MAVSICSGFLLFKAFKKALFLLFNRSAANTAFKAKAVLTSGCLFIRP